MEDYKEIAEALNPIYTGKEYAYVTVVFRKPRFILGAVAMAQSIRASGSIYDLVCMVTPDIDQAARNILAIYYKVVNVDYITRDVIEMRSKKQKDIYGSWIADSFTKWNCLNLTQYDKVLFLDADLIVMESIDHLFNLKAPAATFSLPWAEPFVKPGIHNPYYNYKHGDSIPANVVESGLRHRSSLTCCGSVVLLEPSVDTFNKMCDLTKKSSPTSNKKFYGYPGCISGFDEQAISDALPVAWTNIYQKYNWIVGKYNWIKQGEIPTVYHYLGADKPWDMNRNKWPDLAFWWKYMDVAIKLHPEIKTYMDKK